ncbi:MAG: cytochrome c oxidase subunit II [Alphaproteobacteria bacterium]|jgi:cytochrome c oxidase subunit II|nr:cytochrome c oxidase subunit II [Alphaproteobacteria bacterium]
MLKAVRFLSSALVLSALFTSGQALAEGRSKPWQMWFQDAASPTMERIMEFHDLLFAIEVGIVVLVLVIMAYIIIKFNAKSNPVPSKTTHNTLLEVIWTAIPVIILITIAVPSLKLLYYADSVPDAEMTLKVTGNQWYWSYIYPDNGDIEFDSIIVPTEELKKGQPRLLTVDNEVVLPIKTNIRLLLTSNDVIHNWAIPSLGVKLDTTPGRTNETWVSINKEGSYYGMCSELCGVNHGFMPIHIRAVSKADFVAWTKMAKEKFAANDNNENRAIQVVSAAAATR